MERGVKGSVIAILICGVLILVCGIYLAWGGNGGWTHTHKRDGKMHEFEWVWTADRDGDVDTSGTTMHPSDDFNGYVVSFSAYPDAANPPTDSYDIQINDKYGVNILTVNSEVAGVDLADGASGTSVFEVPIPIFKSGVSPVVDNAGSQNNGRFKIIVMEP